MVPFISTRREHFFNSLFGRLKTAVILTTLAISALTLLVVSSLTNKPAYASASDYALPYPGILPNHPLYPLKQLRDNTLELLTRDNLKKAELHLLSADKKLQMGKVLGEKYNDWIGSTKIIRESEEEWTALQEQLRQAKDMGVTPDVGFIKKLKDSAGHHLLIIKYLYQKAPREYKKNLIQSSLLTQDFVDATEKK